MNIDKILRNSNINIAYQHPLNAQSPDYIGSNTTFYYIDADPGAGKTTYAIKDLIPNLFKIPYNVLIVVPSTDLADQIEQDGNSIIKAIHSDNYRRDNKSCDYKNVCSAIIQQFRDIDDYFPKCLVITEAAFMLCVEIFGLSKISHKWVVIKDEPDEPLTIIETKHISDDVKTIIQEFIADIRNPEDKITEKLVALNPNEIKSSLLKLDDINCEILGPLNLLKSYINNPHIEVVIDYEKLQENKLSYSIFQLPSSYSMFAKAYFMKANFTHSFLYIQWMKSKNVKWEKVDKEFKKIPSERLRIHYYYDTKSFIEQKQNEKAALDEEYKKELKVQRKKEKVYQPRYYGWSKRSREKIGADGLSRIQRYINHIEKQLQGDDYIYVANNNYGEDDIRLSGKRISAVCHGINRYRDYTKIVLMGSYLINDANEKFYAFYFSSTTDAYAFRQTQYYVQQITRTDIRNYDSDKIVDVYVPTLQEALALMVYFPKATIINDMKPKIYAKLKDDYKIEYVNEIIPNNDYIVTGKDAWDKFMTTIEPSDMNKKSFIDTIKNNRTVINGKACSGNTKMLINVNTHLLHLISIKSDISSIGLDKIRDKEKYDAAKKSLPFISCGIYNNNDRLTIANLQGSKLIGFDLDNTDLTDYDINEIIGKWQYMQYTTFSDKGASDIRRLRIIVPYDKPVMLSEHRRILKWFMNKFDDYCEKHKKFHGIDDSKWEPYSKFFAPHKESDIKIKLKVGKKDTIRQPIDTKYILAHVSKEPLIKIPMIHDLVWTNPEFSTITTNTQYSQIMDKEQIIDFIHTYKPYLGSRGHWVAFVGNCRHNGFTISECDALKSYVSNSKTYTDVKQTWASTSNYEYTMEGFTKLLRGNATGYKTNSTTNNSNINTNSNKWIGTKVIVENINLDDPIIEKLSIDLPEKTRYNYQELNDNITEIPVAKTQQKSLSALHEYIFKDKIDDWDLF